MPSEIYCDNCEFPAVAFYETTAGATFFLCQACLEAFGLGQVNPDAPVSRLDPSEEGEQDAEA